MRRVLVVVVNYRAPGLTVACLRSLAGEAEAEPGLRVVVVDNDSSDRSVDQIRAAIAAHSWGWVSTTALDDNAGYSAGNNVAIRAALQQADPPEYFLLLNPDTVVRPGAVGRLAEFLESHPEVGIVGPRLEQPDGTPHCSAFRFPTVVSELDGALRLGLLSRLLYGQRYIPPAAACPTDWVAGAALMARRAVLESVGLLDEGYFLYYEDVDFCLRARRASWACWYVPEARVVHLMGRSTGVTDPRRRERRPAYWFAARRRYFMRHHGRAYAVLADLAVVAGAVGWQLRRRAQRKPDQDPPSFLADMARSVAGLPAGRTLRSQ
jgi:GT2 family glycosyltransferase